MSQRYYTIKDRLAVFAQEVAADAEWYTVSQLADVLECAPSSVVCAFSWMRRNGFAVAHKRVYTEGCNLYRVTVEQLDDLKRQAKRARKELNSTRRVLTERMAHPKPKRKTQRWTTNQPARRKAA